MASSQVEISSSSSPFGCVLRDHNRRDGFRDTNVTATQVANFHNNLKTLVMDRFNDCISITPNHNSQNHNLPNFRVPRTNHNHNTTTNASSVIAPRRSCILDRWDAKQLHQTLSTIDHQHNNNNNNNHDSLPSTQDNSTNDPPAPSKEQILPLPQTDSNKETSKLGASSLVQIWEKRLNVSSNSLNNTNSQNANANATVPSGTQLSDQLVNTELACSVEAGDFEDDAGPGSEDCFADWHSNRTSSSSPPCSTQSQSSDTGESERVRVADIIRRLTAANQSHSSWVEENEHSNESSSYPSLREQVEQQRFLSHVLCSPRIRGRQAFADLLMQMERDRQRELDKLLERRAVSKFGQRGRIQSLLRLKILKRGMAVEDEPQRAQLITSRENHRSSTIMHLRERFSRVGENGSRSPLGEMLNNNDDKTQSDTDTDTDSTHPTYANDNDQAGAVHSIDKVDDNQIPGDVEEQIKEQEHDPPTSEATWQDTPNLNSQDSINGWEDSEAAEENYGAGNMGTSYDWFTDISRPRSYWEDRRQSWYQQMLDSNSANDEIRQLIQRKTVSNFLSSDFRERMDQLMVCRIERQTQQQEEYDEDNEDDEAEEELWCFSERHTQPKSSDNEEEEEEEDETSLISAQYHEASDYLDQSTSPLQLASPSILSSWSYQDNEMGEDSNRAASTSSPQPFPSQFSSNNQQSSLVSRTHHPSIEMELIYDLRGHMEQLYQEMSELRKSIKCCMDMQLMLQQSIKHEVVAGGGGGRKSKKEKSRKGKCCICYEMQIDSLLYRCGHMCSCMKCGKELQWSGGKCPVCRAPIEDVVRASFTTHS